MKLAGFNFTKISIEKFKKRPESIKFNTKMDIISISLVKSDFFRGKEELINIEFNYSLSFEPEYAKIDLGGIMVISLDSKIAKELLKGWKDKKQSTDETRLSIFNVILRKCNLKSIQLEEEIGLPLHIHIPSISKDSIKDVKEEPTN